MKTQNLAMWALICVSSALIFIFYVSVNIGSGHGQPLMPLDDVYIHFQYARQLALGQPYIYNPGQVPSSGATSFLYPFLLAIGYVIGFQELWLGIWSMTLGAVALGASAWAIYQIGRQVNAPYGLCVLIVLIFMWNGATSWHYMSGMETGLVCCFTLWTLFSVWRLDYKSFAIWGTLLSLIRPEGSIMAILALGPLLGLRHLGRWRFTFARRIHWTLALPFLAALAQPVVNFLATGSVWSTGNQAKSLLSLVPRDWEAIVSRIVEQFFRMLFEYLIAYQTDRALWYAPIGITLVGLGALCVMMFRQEHRRVALLVVIWFISISLAIATLDTAFWHFKRYQMPLIVLFFPLALVGLAMAIYRLQRMKSAFVLLALFVVFSAGWALFTAVDFIKMQWLNVRYVYEQPYQMALWLALNTPSDAIVAVHDVGLMRYIGNRVTLDMVGLTTRGAAEAWRNGPGSVAQLLLRHQPHYIASYGKGHGYGLGTLAMTRLFGEPLATFTVELDNRANVALAGPEQGIYRPDWDALTRVYPPQVEALLDDYGTLADFSTPVALIDVADVVDEANFHYVWQSEDLIGFPSEVYDQQYSGCVRNCQVVDGLRRINRRESFQLTLPPADERDLLLITRVLPTYSGIIDIYVNKEHIATRWIPQIYGTWLDIPTYIPRPQGDTNLEITIVPNIPNGAYLPSLHVLYPANAPQTATLSSPLAIYQDGAMQLQTVSYQLLDEQVVVDMTWFSDGSARGDYRLFVHLYADMNQPPYAQVDGYVGAGALPPGNWLQGALRDTITIDVSLLPSGRYTLAMGFYEPMTGERLLPVSSAFQILADRRLILGEVDLESNGR